MIKHVIKKIQMHNLYLLKFVCIVHFGVEAVLENAKLDVLERLELKTFFTPSQPWPGKARSFLSGKFFGIYKK